MIKERNHFRPMTLFDWKLYLAILSPIVILNHDLIKTFNN